MSEADSREAPRGPLSRLSCEGQPGSDVAISDHLSPAVPPSTGQSILVTVDALSPLSEVRSDAEIDAEIWAQRDTWE